MRKFIFISILCALFLPANVRAGTQDFTISSFSADYFLTKDDQNVSQMAITEEIIAQFPQTDQNHGILRALPKSYDGHSLELDVLNVQDAQDKNIQYETYTENDNLVLRIGDPDRYVHGEQVYKIRYTLRGVIKDFGDHQELFWDVNGDQWQQPMTKVSARVHVAPNLEVLEKRKCYTGSLGSTTQNCTFSLNGQTVGVVANSPLAAGENLSFVLAFNPGTFAPYKPSSALVNRWITMAIVIVGLPLIALAVVVRNWRRYGRDPEGRGTIVPEYLPPKEVSVLESSVVLTEYFQAKAMSAQIIDLAVRHFIKIYEVKAKKLLGSKTEYEIELVGDTKALRPEEQKVLHMLFEGAPSKGQRVSLGKQNKTLATELLSLGSSIAKQLTTAGYFRTEPSKAKTPYIVVGIILGAAGFFALPWGWGLVIAGVIVAISSVVMPARTAQGVRLREYLLGLKMYMQLAEAERLKVLQSPHGTLTEKIKIDDKKELVKLYERLLPYAMLFGIEKDWAAQFAHLYQHQPEWYSGSSSFNAAMFAGSVSSFASASTASFAASTSSSGSGFSGGSGGGGGGGGGGGW